MKFLPVEVKPDLGATFKNRSPVGRKKSVGFLAPRVGFEPTTLRLTAGCSTIELPRNFEKRLNVNFLFY
jgi:hypothetical protein